MWCCAQRKKQATNKLRSRNCAQQQYPAFSRNLAKQEGPPAPPSFSKLEEAYKKYQLQDSTNPKDQVVAAYVQALESEKGSALAQAQALRINHDTVQTQFQSLHSSVRSVIEKKDPRPRAEKWGNVPAYIDSLLDRIQQQSEAIELKDTEIVRLKTQSRNDANSHAEQIKAQKHSYTRDRQDLEDKHNIELRSKEVTHNTAVTELNATIAKLQSELVIAERRFQPLTDSECKNQFGLIRTLVHSLAPYSPIIDAPALGTSFDRAKLVRSPEVDDYNYVLEARIWNILFNGIFSSPFRVFGKYGEIFMSSWNQLFGTRLMAESNESWPEPDSRSEKWRYDTVEVLREGLKKGGHHGSVHRLRECYETNSKAVKDAIARVLANGSSDAKTNEIRKIVDMSCSLALSFAIQRCRIQLFAPGVNEMMSLGSGSDAFIDLNKSNKDISGGFVRLVVKPGLRKSGDGRGCSLDTTTILCRSEVYLEKADN